MVQDDAGTWWLSGRFDPVTGEKISVALGARSAPHPASSEGRPDRRTAQQRNADALARLVDDSTPAQQGALGRNRPRLVVTVSRGDPGQRPGNLRGPARHHRRRMAALRGHRADAGLRRPGHPAAAGAGRHPLDIGRAAYPSPRRSGPRSPPGTGTAPSPAAREPPPGPRSTTSTAAPAGAPPPNATGPCCAPPTTTSTGTAGTPPSPGPASPGTRRTPPAPCTRPPPEHLRCSGSSSAGSTAHPAAGVTGRARRRVAVKSASPGGRRCPHLDRLVRGATEPCTTHGGAA